MKDESGLHPPTSPAQSGSCSKFQSPRTTSAICDNFVHCDLGDKADDEVKGCYLFWEETGCKSKIFEKNIKQVDLDITFLKIYS